MSEAQFPGLTDIDLHISYSLLKLQIQLLVCCYNNGTTPFVLSKCFGNSVQGTREKFNSNVFEFLDDEMSLLFPGTDF